MKNAITIAAASAALATAAVTPAKVQQRATGTSSGSLPQVSVKGNGTR
jgi:adenosylcobinamide amidohydrolase